MQVTTYCCDFWRMLFEQPFLPRILTGTFWCVPCIADMGTSAQQLIQTLWSHEFYSCRTGRCCLHFIELMQIAILFFCFLFQDTRIESSRQRYFARKKITNITGFSLCALCERFTMPRLSVNQVWPTLEGTAKPSLNLNVVCAAGHKYCKRTGKRWRLFLARLKTQLYPTLRQTCFFFCI